MDKIGFLFQEYNTRKKSVEINNFNTRAYGIKIY